MKVIDLYGTAKLMPEQVLEEHEGQVSELLWDSADMNEEIDFVGGKCVSSI